MLLWILIILLVLAIAGGGWGYGAYGPWAMSPVGIILAVLVILLIFGRL